MLRCACPQGLWEFDKPKNYDRKIHEASYETASIYGFGHLCYYNNVIEDLRGEAELETDGWEGLKSLEKHRKTRERKRRAECAPGRTQEERGPPKAMAVA